MMLTWYTSLEKGLYGKATILRTVGRRPQAFLAERSTIPMTGYIISEVGWTRA